MKCPKCGKEMIEMPVGIREPCLRYWLCFDCVYREIIECKWQSKATLRSAFLKARGEEEPTFEWCNHPKRDEPCSVESDRETGYVFCPQIREWQEKSASWAKAQNREFEEKRRKEQEQRLAEAQEIFRRNPVKDDDVELLTTLFHPKGELAEEEIEEMTEGAIRRKKKGRRYSGKYKGRGKFVAKDY